MQRKKLFHIDVSPSTNFEELIIIDTTKVEMVDHTPPSQEVMEYEITQEDIIIYLHPLVGISAPQMLKLQRYIKLHKAVVLVYSGSTHNFIHKRVVEETKFYVHLVSNFQIMIVNGEMIPCGGHCENVRIQLGAYHLKTTIFSIDIGCCDIVLGVECYTH